LSGHPKIRQSDTAALARTKASPSEREPGRIEPQFAEKLVIRPPEAGAERRPKVSEKDILYLSC